jgi:hypothetical protein
MFYFCSFFYYVAMPSQEANVEGAAYWGPFAPSALLLRNAFFGSQWRTISSKFSASE